MAAREAVMAPLRVMPPLVPAIRLGPPRLTAPVARATGPAEEAAKLLP